MKESNADICCFKYQEIYPNDEIIYDNYPNIPHFELCTTPLLNFIRKKIKTEVVIWNKIYRVEKIKNIVFCDLKQGEDDVYSLSVLLQVSSVAMLDNVLYYYMQNPESIMHATDKNKLYKNRFKIDEKIITLLQDFCLKSSDKNLNKKCQKYLSETILFRKHLFYTLRYNKSNISQELAYLSELRTKNIFKPDLLRFRFKIIWWLANNHIKSAELAAKL